MVSLAPGASSATIQSLVPEVDAAIDHLLVEASDPLALAFYLWTIRWHNLPVPATPRLAAWARRWVRRILVDGQSGRRRDEEVVSAALAAAALAEHGELGENRESVRRQLAAIVAEERGDLSHPLPFGQPAYAAILLMSALIVGVAVDGLEETADALAAAYRDMMPHGRLFGLGITILTLRHLGRADTLETLGRSVTRALSTPDITPENRAYLADAVWALDHWHVANRTLMDQAEQAIPALPIGFFAGEPAGSGVRDGAAPIASEFHRATLLGLTVELQRTAEARIDAAYRGRRLVGLAAFSGVFFVLACAWVGLGWVFVPEALPALHYWAMNRLTAMPRLTALVFLLAVFAASYLAPFTVVVLQSAWQLLARSAVESDRRIMEVTGGRVRRMSKVWVTVVPLTIGCGLVVALLSAPFVHIFGGR